MTERLLQYIWQFQYFNKTSLVTIEGETLQIIYPGTFNYNQGPDFVAAKIKLGSTTWAGSIELHINSSNWKDHKHAADRNYNNVILHVVWQHDLDLALPFSTLVLGDRVSNLLLGRYKELMQSPAFIPCGKKIQEVNSLVTRAWKERLLVERLQARSELVLNLLGKNNSNWEEVCWWLIARNFGSMVNTEAFAAMARSISPAILAKHRNQLQQVEALLFGQAGLLEQTFAEEYPKQLQHEYRFLKAKYKFPPVHHNMMFLRMRPSNFPTIRLAQLAMLIHTSKHLFSQLKEADSVKQLTDLLELSAGDYWDRHYVFDEPASLKKKNLGKSMTGNIIINTVVPLVFSYGMQKGENKYRDKALEWLEDIKAEQNTITQGFMELGLKSRTAFDSQAVIQLKNEYCNKKRCLECSIGNKLLKTP